MQELLPNPDEVKRAVDLYLPIAYPPHTGALPPHVVALVAQLEHATAQSPRAFFASEIFQRCPGPDEVTEHALRLGNHFYPHMKLLVIWSQAAQHYIYQVDTHDRHCCPPEASPEHAAFCELMARNVALGKQIEAAWDSAGILTFKRFLRDDLARRSRPSELAAR
jgi:hypothetical protein